MTKLNGKMVTTVGLLGLAWSLGACSDESMPRIPAKDRKDAVDAPAINAKGQGGQGGQGIELTVSFATKPLYFGARIERKAGETLPLELTTDGGVDLPATTFIASPRFSTSAEAMLAGDDFLPSTERAAGLLPCAAPAVPSAATFADAQGAPLSPCAAPVQAGSTSEAGLNLTNPAAAVHGIYTDAEAGRVALVICREQASLLDGRSRTHRINNVYIAAAADCRPEHTVEALGFAAAPADHNASAQLLLCLSASGVAGTGRFHYNVLAPLGSGGAFCGEDGDEAIYLGLLPDLRLAAADGARQQGDVTSEIAAAYRHATDEEPAALFLSDWTTRLTDEDDEGAAARQELASTLTTLRRERLALALNAERNRLYGARTSDDTNAAAALSGWVESYATSQVALSTAVASYRDAVLAQPAFADSIQELAKLRITDDSCGVDALALMKAGATRDEMLARLRQAPSLTEVGAYIRTHLGREATNDERHAWNAWSVCNLASKAGLEQAFRANGSEITK